MNVRIFFRVRERKDVDLILGQGMVAVGWHAHTLNAPGKFLIAAEQRHPQTRLPGHRPGRRSHHEPEFIAALEGDDAA